MKINSLLIAAAVTLMAAPAMAQTLPTLTATDSNASQVITTIVAPACNLAATFENPTLKVGPDAISPTFTGTAIGTIAVTCNTPNSSVLIGSTDMTAPGTILEADSAVFTNTLSFVGRVVQTSGGAFGVDSRAGSQGGNTWGSSSSLGFGGTNRRILNASIDMAGLTSGGRLPIAGTYTGKVCITVDPDAALNGIAAGYGLDDDQACS